jgi:hypothetical protein
MRLKLDIDNRTDYSKADLRRIFLAGMRQLDITYRKVLVVYSRSGSVTGWGAYWGTATNWRQQYGYRYADGSYHVKMRLPRKGRGRSSDPAALAESVARVWDHELWHTKGRKHAEMSREVYHCRQPVPWAEGMELRFKETKPKKAKAPERQAATVAADAARTDPKLRRAMKRLEQAHAGVARWDKRHRAAERGYDRAADAGERAAWALELGKCEGKLADYRKKVRRYERRVLELTPHEFTGIAAGEES